MAPFAGWEMPIQYPTGILAEHRAVRAAAGLFDVSHMSAFEVAGPDALAFLDTVLTNSASRVKEGRAQYTCALYPDGSTVDDLFLYRIEAERFVILSNAANAGRMWDWLDAVNSRRQAIDEDDPSREAPGPVALRDLREAGEDSLAGLALQGPQSLSILRELADTGEDRATLDGLRRNRIAPAKLAGRPALVSRTGYTGEPVGFETYLHPDALPEIWNAVLEVGAPLGALPAGLGARDSARIEAGLPLFGHEIEGDLGISITEAGYAFAVKFEVPFFVGRKACKERVERSRRHLLRLRGQGRKTLRPGHAILDEAGRPCGEVTSFAYVRDDQTFIVLACVEEGFAPEVGSTVKGARVPRAGADEVEPRRVVELENLARFPTDEERAGWAKAYGSEL